MPDAAVIAYIGAFTIPLFALVGAWFWQGRSAYVQETSARIEQLIAERDEWKERALRAETNLRRRR